MIELRIHQNAASRGSRCVGAQRRTYIYIGVWKKSKPWCRYQLRGTNLAECMSDLWSGLTSAYAAVKEKAKHQSLYYMCEAYFYPRFKGGSKQKISDR